MADENLDVFESINENAKSIKEQLEKELDVSKAIARARSKARRAAIEYDNPPIPTPEEFCAQELQKAKEKQLENPDFDFRDFYNVGDQIWFVRIGRHKWYGKSIKYLKVRTIYPRMIVACFETGEACCIDYSERDQIFSNNADAKAFFNSLDLPDEDKEAKEREKARRKHKKELEDSGEVELTEEGDDEDATIPEPESGSA